MTESYVLTEPCESTCPVQPNQNAPAPSIPGGSSPPAPATTTPPQGGGGSGAPPLGGPLAAHQSPYDLRRKSPQHHGGADGAGVPGPSTSAATAGGAPASPSCSSGGASGSGYSSAMLPARKRPRRTCSASYESQFLLFFAVNKFALMRYYYFV